MAELQRTGGRRIAGTALWQDRTALVAILGSGVQAGKTDLDWGCARILDGQEVTFSRAIRAFN
jgi:hypothetical protein